MKNTILDELKARQKQTGFTQPLTAHTLQGARTAPRLRTMSAAGTRRLHCACAVIMLTAFMCASHPAGYARAADQQHGVSIAVLPFEVFSIEKEPTLGAEVAGLIAKQLALNPSIVCIDSEQIKTVMRPDDHVALDDTRLRQLAKLLNANCIVMGTVTKIRAEHSIDVQIFNTASGSPNYKTFAEGLEIKSLVGTVTTALDQEIMKKSERIPAAERPQVSTGRQPLAQTPAGGFDVDRELLAAFGPMKEKAPKSAGAAVEPSAQTKPADSTSAAPAPNGNTARSATETAAPPAPEVAAIPFAESGDAHSKEKNSSKKESLRKKTDPGFFALSKAISINSDTMEYDNRENKAVFNGNVVARQDDMVMFANSMNVYYSEQGGGLSRVEAQGNVRVVQGDRIATGSSIVFNNANQTIVATGDPRIWQGDNVVHGSKITVYLKEERTVVESEPSSRASATIYPGSDKKKP